MRPERTALDHSAKLTNVKALRSFLLIAWAPSREVPLVMEGWAWAALAGWEWVAMAVTGWAMAEWAGCTAEWATMECTKSCLNLNFRLNSRNCFNFEF